MKKEWSVLFNEISGKNIKVFTDKSKQHYCTGLAASFTGLYLILKNVVIWNGQKEGEKMINAGVIKKIEIINEQ